MRKYTTIAILSLQAGITVGLSHAQAAPRAHALKPIELNDKTKMGVYQVTAPIQFKVGETIYTDADLNKSLVSALEPEETTRQKAADRKRSDAEGKELAALRAKAKQWDDIEPELPVLIEKAKALDSLQPQLEDLQTRAALWDSLPEAVRADAIGKAEAELKAADANAKAK